MANRKAFTHFSCNLIEHKDKKKLMKLQEMKRDRDLARIISKMCYFESIHL